MSEKRMEAVGAGENKVEKGEFQTLNVGVDIGRENPEANKALGDLINDVENGLGTMTFGQTVSERNPSISLEICGFQVIIFRRLDIAQRGQKDRKFIHIGIMEKDSVGNPKRYNDEVYGPIGYDFDETKTSSALRSMITTAEAKLRSEPADLDAEAMVRIGKNILILKESLG